MRPVSDAFLRAVRGSHRMVARARVCTTFQTGTNPTGTEIPILAGNARLSSKANIRSTLDLTTDGTNMWPSASNLLLAPYGNELFIERGLSLGGGGVEWVSLGYHRIHGPEQDKPSDGPIRLSAQDRMAAIVDGRLTSPRQFTSSTTFGSVVSTLITDIYPSATIEWDDGTATSSQAIGRNLLVERERYAALKDLVSSVGKVFYWDYRGVLVIKTPPDPSTPVFEITHGQNGVLVEMSRELSREGVYNGVVATGEGTDSTTPVHAVAIDSNPRSPTYWYGTFGKVPKFYSSPFITTTAQAQTASNSMLIQSIGLPYSVNFGTVPNPALEPLDPVRVSFSNKAGREIHVIETLNVPLTAKERMTGKTKEKTLVRIGSL